MVSSRSWSGPVRLPHEHSADPSPTPTPRVSQVKRLKEVIECHSDTPKKTSKAEEGKSQSRSVCLIVHYLLLCLLLIFVVVLTVVFSILLSRYWTEDEHSRFLEALQSVGPKDVKAIAAIVSSRSATQVRTHAQKYFLKLVSAPPLPECHITVFLPIFKQSTFS